MSHEHAGAIRRFIRLLCAFSCLFYREGGKKISDSCKNDGADQTNSGKAPDTQKPSEEGLTAPTVTVPDMPVIGMDGKTTDGAMPYEILKQQLAFLRLPEMTYKPSEIKQGKWAQRQNSPHPKPLKR